MRNHWAVCAFVCALIATLPAKLAAQTTAPADDFPKWGMYVRLLDQSRKGDTPEGFRLHWRWQTPGEVLLEEWYGPTTDPDKPAYVMTIRLGPQPGTFILKSSTMMGKEWMGTLQADGSISYVGKGLLKMRYNIRLDEQGAYVQSDPNGKPYGRFAPVTDAATPVVAEASPAPAAPPTPAAPVTPEKSAPVVAKQEPLPAQTPVAAPRKLSEDDLARLNQSVQKSRARSLEQARQIVADRAEAARQAEIESQARAAAEAQRQAEQAEAEAEFEAERAQKALAWQQMARASEQALADSTARLQDTTARIQAQQADAVARQRAQAQEAEWAERQRQMDRVREANQRQADEAARLAAQRQQYEQQRADALAAERERTQQQRASTDTDANRCISREDVRQNDTFQGNTAAYVVNGCDAPVDVRICLMTESGWKCGATLGLAEQARWSYSAFHATGPVFVDARTTGSNRQFASPN